MKISHSYKRIKVSVAVSFERMLRDIEKILLLTVTLKRPMTALSLPDKVFESSFNLVSTSFNLVSTYGLGKRAGPVAGTNYCLCSYHSFHPVMVDRGRWLGNPENFKYSEQRTHLEVEQGFTVHKVFLKLI